jgi:FkbM family methyltransferase
VRRGGIVLWRAAAFYPPQPRAVSYRAKAAPGILKKAIQDALLSAYRYARRRGVFETNIGRRLFLSAYWTYKKFWEADISYLRPFIARDSWIIDAGANVGFFTSQFSQWVSGEGRVLAVEPEAANFAALEETKARLPSGELIVTKRCLLADVDATLCLELNPDNPADHRIGRDGIPTPALRLDTLMAELHWPRVGLIKIDVQGAEPRLLAGAHETLARNRPAVFMEIDDLSLRRFGSSAEALQNKICSLGYEMYEADENSLAIPIDAAQSAVLRSRVGYADLLFLPIDARRRTS